MLFSRFRNAASADLLVACILCVTVMFAGCKDSVTDSDDVFADARDRVSENVLGEIADESEDVLRNLTNVLAALPQVCATPLVSLGSFTSALPALGQPRSIKFVGEDDEETEEGVFPASWILKWRNVLLGSDGNPPADDTLNVDVTLNVRPISAQQSTLRATPFALVPQSALLATATTGQPASLEDGDAEGFFLFQDEVTGVWTLRWRTGTPKVFDGLITGTVFSRVIRRVPKVLGDDAERSEPGEVVESLDVGSGSNQLQFSEMTEPGDEKGVTFFARPGELVRFELRIGDTEDDLEPITIDQLHIGSGDRSLPPSEDLERFGLATNVPLDPTGAPMISPGAELGTFIWQDVDSDRNACNDGEDHWRVRLSSTGEQTTFTGNVIVQEDDTSAALRFRPLGGCQGELDDEQTLDYTCTLEGDQSGGYDICVTRRHRVLFIPAVDNLGDPGLIFVGADVEGKHQPPPSPDPSSIIFDIDLEERQSGRDLTLSDARIVLSGNSSLSGIIRLNPDQLSLEPLCGRLPTEIEEIVRPDVASAFGPGERLVQPRVRLTGDGDYSTSRFEGSVYLLQEVEFLTPAVRTLDDEDRFPDRGRIELLTRLEGELENTTTIAEVENIEADEAGQVTLPVTIEISLSRVIFEFDANGPDVCEECVMALTVE